MLVLWVTSILYSYFKPNMHNNLVLLKQPIKEIDNCYLKNQADILFFWEISSRYSNARILSILYSHPIISISVFKFKLKYGK